MAALAQELAVDPYTQRVSDLLPDQAAAAEGQWGGVTLEHLIDMSAGHYRFATQDDDYLGAFSTTSVWKAGWRRAFCSPTSVLLGS